MKTLSTLFLCFFFVTGLIAQSVSTEKSVVPPGDKIVVNFSGFPGNGSDWIAVAQVSMKDDQSNEWYYTGGKASGSITFSAQNPGDYEVRGYFNNEYTVRCRYRFSIGTSDPGATAKAETEKLTYASNEAITVDFSGFPGNADDWIAIAPASMKDDQSNQWYYTGGKTSGTMNFSAQPPGEYEVRGYYKNAYFVKCRYRFTVGAANNTTTTTTTNTVTTSPAHLCRRELSTFYSGVGGLGSAWGRAAHETTVLSPGAVSDMQLVIGNAKAAIDMVKCIPYDTKKLDALMAKLPTLTNVQAVAEIEASIKEIQAAIAMVKGDCESNLMALYVTGIHIGAAQAHANSRMLAPAPMPADLQTVIFNHLKTAQDAFAGFSGCTPGFPLSSFTAINLNSSLNFEPHINIIMLHCSILWNIALSDCCCDCQ